MTETQFRISGHDGLRGAAALGVALFHFTYQYDVKFGHSPNIIFSFSAGHYGVNLFFMLSGFVIFMSLAKEQGPLDFWISRGIRLIPAFWVAIPITVLATQFSGLPELQVNRTAILANFTMIPELLGFTLVDHSYWSLQVELIFYALLYLIVRMGWKEKIPVILTAILSLTLLNHYWPYFHNSNLRIVTLMREALLIQYIPYFSVGIIGYRIGIQKEFRRISNYLVMGLAFLAIKSMMPWPSVVLHGFVLGHSFLS